jgi:DNA-binding transcriptional regulator GbsR (MarR family)
MENQEAIGMFAGKVWTVLNSEKGTLKIDVLKKQTGLSDSELWAAIGWLARENKIVLFSEKKGKKAFYYVCLKLEE